MLNAVIKIANLVLLLLFTLAFGSTLFTSSISSILGSPIQFVSALCVVLGFLGTGWTMLPSAVPKFAVVKKMLMGTALGCTLTWLWMWWTNSLGNICSGLSLGDFCGGQIMHYVLIAVGRFPSLFAQPRSYLRIWINMFLSLYFTQIYIASAVLQCTFAITSAYPVPHLSPSQQETAAGHHKSRVVPTGNLDPSADFSSEDANASSDAFAGGSHVEGKPHAEGDSEMHTHMHLPHGSKDQEELEEQIKLTLGRKDD
ncbi:hypothetical protein JCM11251_002357 [Rhodosporidiobolus azoricus]